MSEELIKNARIVADNITARLKHGNDAYTPDVARARNLLESLATALEEALAKREAVAEGMVMVPQSWIDAATKAKQLTPDVCRAYPGAASAHITGLANLILQLAASQQAAKGEGT